MRLSNRCCWICACLFVTFIHSLAAQSGYKLSDSVVVKLIASEKKYFEESTHGSPHSVSAVNALLEKSAIYQQVGKFELALKNLLRIPVDSLGADLAQTVRYELAVAYYTAGDFQDCRNTIVSYLTAATQLDSIKCNWLNIISLLNIPNDENIDTARKLYVQFVVEHAAISLQDSLLSLWVFPKLKNPDRAERLSLIPGLGQVYAGNWKKAIAAVLVQSSFIGLGSYWLSNHYYITSALVGYGMFFSFYMGGQRLAHKLAVQVNQRRIQEFNQKISSAVLLIEQNRRFGKSVR